MISRPLSKVVASMRGIKIHFSCREMDSPRESTTMMRMDTVYHAGQQHPDE